MAKTRTVQGQRIEVWQDETTGDGSQPLYVWCVSVVALDGGGEIECLYAGPAIEAIRFAIRESRRRKLPWGVSDRFSHYTDFTGLPLSRASWAVSFIELESRQRGVFVLAHLREIEREEEEEEEV
jgi:hypothetical protein